MGKGILGIVRKDIKRYGIFQSNSQQSAGFGADERCHKRPASHPMGMPQGTKSQRTIIINKSQSIRQITAKQPRNSGSSSQERHCGMRRIAAGVLVKVRVNHSSPDLSPFFFLFFFCWQVILWRLLFLVPCSKNSVSTPLIERERTSCSVESNYSRRLVNGLWSTGNRLTAPPNDGLSRARNAVDKWHRSLWGHLRPRVQLHVLGPTFIKGSKNPTVSSQSCLLPPAARVREKDALQSASESTQRQGGFYFSTQVGSSPVQSGCVEKPVVVFSCPVIVLIWPEWQKLVESRPEAVPMSLIISSPPIMHSGQ